MEIWIRCALLCGNFVVLSYSVKKVQFVKRNCCLKRECIMMRGRNNSNSGLQLGLHTWNVLPASHGYFSIARSILSHWLVVFQITKTGNNSSCCLNSGQKFWGICDRAQLLCEKSIKKIQEIIWDITIHYSLGNPWIQQMCVWRMHAAL